ncbi:N-acetylmuramoyl-L-alanine amidase [Spirosoma sp. KNUC1025]|uniref:N-acetylmuramoyl-L-alanine amidase family protein n=1 Tax=Spirosoma sp. KNUC1025 TaxID=2894082 RepID=UPI00386CA58B|nr:N-acetylmuramoyl-L-alanine amidase [Spirosoma sp. KNUC1025]
MNSPTQIRLKLSANKRTWILIILTLFFAQASYSLTVSKEKGKRSTTRSKNGKKRVTGKVTKRVITTKTHSRDRKESVAKGVNAARKTGATLSTTSLFGPAYAHVAVRDQQLRGTVYYLASGHGGPDPGAIGHYGKQALAEDEYAYDVTIRLARALLEHGATVYMIIRDPNDGIRDEKILKVDHDEVTYPNQRIPLNQTMRLRQCTDAVNQLHRHHKEAYQRMVTIHVDSRSEGQTIDVFFYHHEQSKVGKRLAKHIHKSFQAGYKRSQPTRNYLGTVSDRSSLYVVRNSHPPTVFIELGNIRNEKDQRRFLLADNRQALANWICTGLQRDYRLH